VSEREARKALKEGIERSLRELLAEDTLEDSGQHQLALSRRIASAEQFIRIYLQEMLPKFVIDCAIHEAETSAANIAYLDHHVAVLDGMTRHDFSPGPVDLRAFPILRPHIPGLRTHVCCAECPISAGENR